MILLRPADPDRPIIISNAIEVDVDDAPPQWLIDEISYLIESADVIVESA